MTTEKDFVYADEWGTTFDDEIRKYRDDWIVMAKKRSEAEQEKEELFKRLVALTQRAHAEGWKVRGPEFLYGRDFYSSRNRMARDPNIVNTRVFMSGVRPA